MLFVSRVIRNCVNISRLAFTQTRGELPKLSRILSCNDNLIAFRAFSLFLIHFGDPLVASTSEYSCIIEH